jgi:uncharacterized protein YacL
VRRPRRSRVPNGVVELLRLLTVVFFAGIGSMVGTLLNDDGVALGPFGAAWVGIIVGSGVGYALGGVLGRTTVAAVGRTEQALRGVSAEEIVAGTFGGLVGGLIGVAFAWPVFFLPTPALSVPLFGFAVVTLGLLGYRIGANKRSTVLGLFGSRAGMAPTPRAASSYPKVVDSSVAIDGRILDVVRAGFLHGSMVVPTPVITELQGLADAGDDSRRAKGRRGLDVLEALKREPGVEVEILEADLPAVPEVDAKLVRICIDQDAALLTLDSNLAKAAGIAGVRVLNMHRLALAMRPPVTAGDEVHVLLTKAGKEPGQAVGYLDDGTMVVVERSRDLIGHEVLGLVTSVLTTANGRMVFARPVEEPSEELSERAAHEPSTAGRR